MSSLMKPLVDATSFASLEKVGGANETRVQFQFPAQPAPYLLHTVAAAAIRRVGRSGYAGALSCTGVMAGSWELK